MQFLPSTHPRLAVMATLGALLARPPLAQATTPTFIQGLAFSTPRIPSTTVTLTRPVAQGDLLIGWFSQYNAPGGSGIGQRERYLDARGGRSADLR